MCLETGAVACGGSPDTPGGIWNAKKQVQCAAGFKEDHDGA
ncbi:hypothetical protein GGQ68_003036 [Sagittula marina]|uniref:Uncharacterized protein n=1 Tax=Sagittula marina TaxID=943940 RepID=A0A7W6DPA5_9RHOB|nr:hypothetical protein [Sagittula marina]